MALHFTHASNNPHWYQVSAIWVQVKTSLLASYKLLSIHLLHLCLIHARRITSLHYCDHGHKTRQNILIRLINTLFRNRIEWTLNRSSDDIDKYSWLNFMLLLAEFPVKCIVWVWDFSIDGRKWSNRELVGAGLDISAGQWGFWVFCFLISQILHKNAFRSPFILGIKRRWSWRCPLHQSPDSLGCKHVLCPCHCNLV